jgi:hypothetical protein
MSVRRMLDAGCLDAWALGCLVPGWLLGLPGWLLGWSRAAGGGIVSVPSQSPLPQSDHLTLTRDHAQRAKQFIALDTCQRASYSSRPSTAFCTRDYIVDESTCRLGFRRRPSFPSCHFHDRRSVLERAVNLLASKLSSLKTSSNGPSRAPCLVCFSKLQLYLPTWRSVTGDELLSLHITLKYPLHLQQCSPLACHPMPFVSPVSPSIYLTCFVASIGSLATCLSDRAPNPVRGSLEC